MSGNETFNYQIEKDVPLCPNSAGSKPGRLTQLIRAMEVGDSMLIPKKSRNSVSQRFAHLRPKRFITRTISDTECRIWRVA